MPLPKLDDAQIAWVIEQVAAYIERQRSAFALRAVPLSDNQKMSMCPFFTERILNSARVVLAAEQVGNPPFYRGLMRMGFQDGSLPDFALMAATTFVDVVVSHKPITSKLLFHELVHVAQYEKLGLADFAAKYVRGFLNGGSYEAIPLEVNAYELEVRFAAAPTKPFSVEIEVQSWIDARRF
ncbi:MAG: hypothetical protein WAR24_04210 [Candidatus Acidiferrales bacterium]